MAPALHLLGGPPRRLRRHPSAEGNFLWLRRCTPRETTPSAPPPFRRGGLSVLAVDALVQQTYRFFGHPAGVFGDFVQVGGVTDQDDLVAGAQVGVPHQ